MTIDTLPRQETDHLGDPVAEYHDEEENKYYEAYTAPESHNPELIFIAQYTQTEDKWIKEGLDRRHIKNLFNEKDWPVYSDC